MPAHLKRLIVLFGVIMLTACATMTGGEQQVLISKQKVQAKLSERLSTPIALLKVFNIQLTNPVVSFDEANNRMHVSMDSDLNSQLLKGKHYKGAAALSGALEYDASRQAVVLMAPKIEQLSFDGLAVQQAAVLNAFATVISSELLNGLVLYKVDPADLKVLGRQYTPKALHVTQQGLQITLTPEQ